MNLRHLARFCDWIWHIRGSVPLAAGQSGDQALDRLGPLFDEPGTTSERNQNTITFRKKNQLAQDKMSVFDGGILQVDHAGPDVVLRYDLASGALLACFLAPLLFLGIAQLTIAVGNLEEQSGKVAAKSDGKSGKDAKKANEKKPEIVLNPVDKFLGAPAPEKPKKDAKGKDGKDKDDGGDKKPSPTSAYVFAGIFAALYIFGRVLEAWLIQRLFKKSLAGA